MEQKNNQVILYELYTYKTYTIPGRRYYSDEICDYAYSSEKTGEEFSSLILDNIEAIQKWFLNHVNEPIPSIRKIEYIGEYKGLNDVIKVTMLSYGNATVYCTAINQDLWVYYDKKKSQMYKQEVWSIGSPGFFGSENRLGENHERLDNIYNAFSQRGIIIENNVYENSNDRSDCFSYTGDTVDLRDNRYNTKNEKKLIKKPVLYKMSIRDMW